MPLARVTQSGNISIPKAWRDEFGIALNSTILLEKKKEGILIQPLNNKSLAEAFKIIDDEMKSKGITFTRKESIQDDLYD